MQKKSSEDLYNKYLDKIIKYLSYSARTEKQVRGKINTYLAQGGIEPDDREGLAVRLMDYLRSLNLLSDTAILTAASETLSKEGGVKSRKQVVKKLLSKGISYEQVEESLPPPNPELELSKAVEALSKKYSALKIPETRSYQDLVSIKLRMVRYLAGRGFDSQACYEAVDYFLKLK